MCFEFLYGLLPRFIQAIIKSFSRLFISILEGVLFLQGSCWVCQGYCLIRIFELSYSKGFRVWNRMHIS